MSLVEKLSWAKVPVIINAPMGGFAGAELAMAVSRAGGLGMVASIYDMDESAADLATVDREMQRINNLLPIGIGILPFILDLEKFFPVLEKYPPTIIWLFAPKHLSDYATLVPRVRAVSPRSQIWIQVGYVSAALEVAASCSPDVLVLQGSDHGGHGYEQTASLLSLFPEAADALAAAGHTNIHLVAAGGIAGARSAAAALALGAEGIVIGTRFLAASETLIHPAYREAVLAAKDGGRATAKAGLFDLLKGPSIWPLAMDGRALAGESWEDFRNGVDLGEIQRRYGLAMEEEAKGFGVGGRAAMWAGTGVGLVRKEQGAGEIVEEVRAGAVRVLEQLERTYGGRK